MIVSAPTLTHYPGGEFEPAFLDFGIVDDQMANARDVTSKEVGLDLSIGKHPVARINISNNGHVCYVAQILKPKALPRKTPIGCARRLVDAPSSIQQIGADTFRSDTNARAKAEICKLHDLVNDDCAVRKDSSW